MANDLEVGWDILQNLGYVFAENAQLAAAIWAAILCRIMLNDLAGKMRGQRLA
jgi:hypothetical protein